MFYLCGHYNRPGEEDAFVAALQELKQVGGSPAMSVAVYLDLESGAQRIALRHGEHSEPELLGTVNSGDPETLEQFLLWAFDTCPARRYVLVMAGLGIMDADSVVGRPPFDAARLFAICDDRATNDAIELHELSATIKTAFPPDSSRRLVMLACDMYAMQFMEVAYELRGLLDLLVGIQPGAPEAQAPLLHWPYAHLLQGWQQVVAAPLEDATPVWNSPIGSQALLLAQQTVAELGEHYGSSEARQSALTVSAINLEALVPLAQALDTFSVVFLQWLSNEVVWRARERVVFNHTAALSQSLSYDLDELATSTATALYDAADEALVRWAANAIPVISYPSLSRTLRVMGSTARSLAATAADGDVYRRLADEMSACRSRLERLLAVAADDTPDATMPDHSHVDICVRALFTDPAKADSVREPAAWAAIIERSRERFAGAQARELTDAFNGIAAANQLACLAMRVSVLTRGLNQDPENTAVIAVWPASGRCGLGLYRPLDLDKLAESNYLELRFSRELHWTALLTAVDLIKHHARMLWRLLESQLTAAPLEARYQLMRRLAGDRALTGRHAAQLSALSTPNALFLTIDPRNGEAADDHERPEGRPQEDGDAIVSYCVRLSSLDRSATVVEKRNQITRARLERVLAEIDK
ncbi:MAG: clostripain-related cysteine peptidase, partial [Vicinamibacterales bacterium]